MIHFFFALVTSSCAFAQAWTPAPDLDVPPPPREFRGAWVASVANIDWPSAKTLPADRQQEELRTIVETAARLHLNALLVQVRPTADSLYVSDIEPWSEFLTGLQGRAPDPAYDPLALWVDECHARAVECHAWFNPFRTRHFEATGPDAPTHVNTTRPDLTHAYDRYTWFDPAEPEAQDRALRVILDVVMRYDIDGVHIDDYFYPYPKAGVEFPDDASWARYRASGGPLSRQDWRRDNINRFVKRLYDQVKAAKPHVRVGISPFGIWRPGNPAGVDGYDAYEKLCADARLWLREGWLDYAAPQLYWKIDAPKQPFAALLNWWVSQSSKGRPVYAGLYTSKCNPADGKWPAAEIVAQVEQTRRTPGAGGAIHFSMKALVKDYGGVAKALLDGPYAAPALTPPVATQTDETAPALVARCEAGADGRLSLTWDPPADGRVVIAAWMDGGEWTFVPLPAKAGGVEHGTCGAAAVAPVSRSGVLGAWTAWRSPGAK